LVAQKKQKNIIFSKIPEKNAFFSDPKMKTPCQARVIKWVVGQYYG
jgi:hypothetical protein